MPEHMGVDVEEIRRISVGDAVALIELAGGDATEEEIRANIEAGAPLNADGSLDLLHYGAWLIENGRNERR